MKNRIFDYGRCKELILDGILESLEQRKVDLMALPKHPIGSSQICGMSLDIFPWHNSIQISFCDNNAQFREEYIAEWKYFDFISSASEDYQSLRIASDYVSSFWNAGYDDSEDEEYDIELRLKAHIIFLAGAEAVLDKQVAQLLQLYGLDSAKYSEHPFDTGKFFIVCDDDQTLKSNYCEIIRANMATKLFFEELKLAKSIE